MALLIAWYLVLCFVAMPLDSKLSRRHRWFAPPVVTLLHVVGLAFYAPDVAETRAATTAFRALPIEWQCVIGIAICAPVLWQAAGAYQDRRARQ